MNLHFFVQKTLYLTECFSWFYPVGYRKHKCSSVQKYCILEINDNVFVTVLHLCVYLCIFD
jgi:hypothetical protein